MYISSYDLYLYCGTEVTVGLYNLKQTSRPTGIVFGNLWTAMYDCSSALLRAAGSSAKTSLSSSSGNESERLTLVTL